MVMLGNCVGKGSAGSMLDAGLVSPEVWTKMLMKVAQGSPQRSKYGLLLWRRCDLLALQLQPVTAGRNMLTWRPEWAVFIYPTSEKEAIRFFDGSG